MKALLCGAVMTLVASGAMAGESYTSHCVDVSIPKGAIDSRHGRWIELTPDQFQFLRGIAAMWPTTPPGLPPGDKAVMGSIAGDEGAAIFFIDGTRACWPLMITHELIDMLTAVGTGEPQHEKGGL